MDDTIAEMGNTEIIDLTSLSDSAESLEELPPTPLTSIESIFNSTSASSNAETGVSQNDGYLAFGSIEVQNDSDDSATPSYTIRGRDGSEPYPTPWLTMATRKGWVRVYEIYPSCSGGLSKLRIYLLPEDIDRGNRGSLKDFRKFAKHLLGYINSSDDSWFDSARTIHSVSHYETPRSSQEESLFYIFNTLRSPSPNLNTLDITTYGYKAVSDIINDSILGLKTELYPYQRRSVAAMVQREAEPAKMLDPRKPIYKDINGQPFYLDINDGTVLKHPPLYTEPQGGILAETMGYGKTLICIALILATRGHYPKVPEGRIDSTSLRPREKVSSLLAMVARRTKHEALPWKAEFSALSKAGYHYDRCIEELKKYHREYAEPIFTPTTPDRKGKRDSANIVRLCSATLVIVPPNLLGQWQHEINKHTEENALDVLTIDQPNKAIPSWEEIMNYDVVLITKARFEQEYRDDDLHQGRSRKGDARYQSPLTELRWLRVICDEGHGFAGSSSRTNAMTMLDKMYIERRWVVSGTPSSTLHGVEVGLSATNSFSTESAPGTPAPESMSARKASLSSALQKRRAPSARDLEAKDLERLRLIVVNFLRLQPWANVRGSNDVANWKKYLAPTVDADGVSYTPPALRDVLQTLIIRHRIEDIDTDLTLPPLHNKIVYLEPSYHDKLAINMFFMVLTSNYVTSEREDEDYMFHPKNRKKLDLLINNMRQASFHWVGFTEHQIRETLRINNDYLNNNIDRISDADGVLLTEAIQNGERALSDPSWKAFATLHEIGVYVTRFPEHARESWALDGKRDDPVLLGTLQAREAQKYVRERLARDPWDELSSLAGAGVKAMNAAWSRADDEQKAQQKAMARLNEDEKQQVGATDEPKLRAPSASSSLSTPKKSSSSKSSTRTSTPKKSPSSTPQKRRRGSGNVKDELITPPASPNTILSSPPPSSSHTALSLTTITSFTSSKLTYLTSRLLNLPSTTKSLVFYQHNNTAFFIAEALELLSIPFRIYANTLSVAARNAYLSEFNSPDSDIRVMLMDIKQASLGLHIACASYVCIVSPIWDAGIESQAIKRAHRIGQTQEVVVETLVLRNTFEEEMVRRRRWRDEHLDVNHDVVPAEDLQEQTGTGGTKKSKSRNGNVGKSLLDDRHMVNVLKDVKFLQFSRDERDVRRSALKMDVPIEKRLLFKDALADMQSRTVSNRECDDTITDNADDVRIGVVDKSRAKLRKLQKGAKVAVGAT